MGNGDPSHGMANDDACGGLLYEKENPMEALMNDETSTAANR